MSAGSVDKRDAWRMFVDAESVYAGHETEKKRLLDLKMQQVGEYRKEKESDRRFVTE